MENEIIIFENDRVKLEVPYTPDQETVWLAEQRAKENAITE